MKLLLSRFPKPHVRERYFAECTSIDNAVNSGHGAILEGSIIPRLSERMRVAVYVRSMENASARGARYASAIDIFLSATEDSPLLGSLIAPDTIMRLRKAAENKAIEGRTSRRSSRGSISADAQGCLEWMVREDLSVNDVFDERYVVRALILRSSTGLKDIVTAEGGATLRRLTDRDLFINNTGNDI